jgi:flavin-dependent dehydrogenase
VRSSDSVRTIAVIGGNVAGTTAAILLARSGRSVRLFDHPACADPNVGESLLPAAVPILRDLLPEAEIAASACLKPGLTFDLPTGRKLCFQMRDLEGISTTYSYNVARPQFDDLLRRHAEDQGVRIVSHRAEVDRLDDQILLKEETLAAGDLDGQPDFVIDATGRRQLLTTALRGAVSRGSRSAIALYAHYRNAETGGAPGHAVLAPMERGWSWRIPLPGRTSVGIVMTEQHWSELGGALPGRFQAAVERDPLLCPALAAAERLSPVLGRKYNQYQAERLRGANWALVGDAAGFVDPTLSPGVTVALQGASELAACFGGGRDLSVALARWEDRCKRRLDAWNEVVSYFYDGRLFSLIQQGEDNVARRPWLAPLGRFLKRAVGATMVGARTESVLSRKLVRLLATRGLSDYRPEDWAIR